MNLAHTGFFVLATNKTLQVTFWTRLWDLIKGMLLYGTVNWRRASDGLKPPKLTPHQRKIAMPSKNLDVIKPRENPQAALVKTTPKKAPPKAWDVTVGAIVSDPLLPPDEPPVLPKRFYAAPPSGYEAVEPPQEETVIPVPDEQVIIRRRRRHHRHGTSTRLAPRSPSGFGDTGKPGLFGRLFGSK